LDIFACFAYFVIYVSPYYLAVQLSSCKSVLINSVQFGSVKCQTTMDESIHRFIRTNAL